VEKKSAFKKGGMFNGASGIVFQYAKDLRKIMTPAEMLLWGHLKKGTEGYKFRRQHPIESYVVDFYCHRLRLIIEVDGNYHDKPETKNHDLQREADLKKLGYFIIRFSNDDVLKNLQFVLNNIQEIVNDDLKKPNQK
jgi:cyclase